MVVDQTTFQIGQRVRIISSDSTATIEATFTLVLGYYDVCLDDTATHRIAFETDLEALDMGNQQRASYLMDDEKKLRIG